MITEAKLLKVGLARQKSMVPAGGDVDGAAVCVGCTVELHGLTKASLNGARGMVVSYDAERARFGVSGVGDGVIAVKPENLQRVDEQVDAFEGRG